MNDTQNIVVPEEAIQAILKNWDDVPIGDWYCNIYRHEAHLPKYASPGFVFGPPRGTATFPRHILEANGHIGLYVRSK
jgi:hypothetical protein